MLAEMTATVEKHGGPRAFSACDQERVGVHEPLDTNTLLWLLI